MAEFLCGDEIVQTIRESLSNSKQADFAVAYWGKRAIEKLGLDKIDTHVRILCDLWSLKCNPYELEKLFKKPLAPRFKLKTKNRLHAKVYITANRVIAGSANASINGLGEEGDESDLKLEAAIACSEEKVIADANTWFKNQWDGAKPVDKTTLDLIKPLWKPENRSPDLLSLLACNRALFIQRPVRLAIFTSMDKAAYEHVGRDKDAIYIDHTSRWKISPGEYVISYWVERSGRGAYSLKFPNEGGAFRIKGHTWKSSKNGKKLKAILADETNKVDGFKFSHDDYKKLGMYLRHYLKRYTSKQIQSDILMEKWLSDLPQEVVKGLKNKLNA